MSALRCQFEGRRYSGAIGFPIIVSESDGSHPLSIRPLFRESFSLLAELAISRYMLNLTQQCDNGMLLISWPATRAARQKPAREKLCASFMPRGLNCVRSYWSIKAHWKLDILTSRKRRRCRYNDSSEGSIRHPTEELKQTLASL